MPTTTSAPVITNIPLPTPVGRWKCPDCKAWVKDEVQAHHCYMDSLPHYVPMPYPVYPYQHYYSPWIVTCSSSAVSN